jgi:sugar (pentulose or hexulose) kinase
VDDPLVMTIDLGSSSTKVALWSQEGLVAIGRAPIATRTPRPDQAEQDPSAWWTSSVSACKRLPAKDRRRVAVVGFSTQREALVPVEASGEPIGLAIARGDRRAVEQADRLGDEFEVLTGVVPDPACAAARLAWLREHEPDRLARARWILAPRDLVVLRLTGRAVTDPSVTSRGGLVAIDGARLEGGGLLPDVEPSTAVVGASLDEPSTALGVAPGTPVVAGAGDRACEILGVDAALARPMVSWGTTAGVSIPVPHVPPPSRGVLVTRGAIGGYVMEAGLSSGGAALAWVAELSQANSVALAAEAERVAPGADGLIALPWLSGARAPWWEARIGMAFTGLAPHHGPEHLARAIVEGVAFDAARCLERSAPDAVELALAGGGAAMPLWRRVLSGVASRPVVSYRHGEAASVGAALLAGRAAGIDLERDVLDPVERRELPPDDEVLAYAELRMRHDMVARATIEALSGAR